MELYSHVILISALLIGLSQAESGDAADKLCDAQMWYLDLLAEGPLSGSVHSDHQRAVHDKIKALMERLKNQGQGYQVACSRLQTFEDILIESKVQGGASASPKKDSEEKSSQRSKEEIVFSERVEESNLSKETKSVDKPEEKSEESASKVSAKSEAFEYDFLLKDRENKDSSEKSDQKERATTDRDDASKEDKASSDVEARPSREAADKAEAVDPTEVDETDLSEDISEQEEDKMAKSTNSEDLGGAALFGDNASNNTQENSADTETINKNRTGSRVQYRWLLQGVSLKNQSQAIEVFRLKRKRTMTVKLCDIWMKKCRGKTRSKCLCYYIQTLLFVCDIFDTPLPEILSEATNYLAIDVQQACNVTNVCSRMCFYAFENLQCLQAYDTTLEKVPVQKTFSSEDSLMKETEGEENKGVEEISSLRISSNSEKIPEDGDTDDHDSQEKDSESRTKDGNSSDPDNEERTVKTDAVGRKGEGDAADELKQEDTTAKDSRVADFPGKARQQFYSPEEIQQALSKERAELERLFHAQASEYAGKIQGLELLVTKLENQVLVEKLTKQNDSVTVSRLETQILRLENQLLKLSHSHAKLHEEHERAQRTQRPDFLGLDHVTQTSSSSLATYNASLQREQQQLLTLQQARLQELKDALRNHTTQVDKLQSKTTLLEEQNQMLMQMVLNQSALIASILGQLQQLSEDNARRRQETTSLQSQVALQHSSDKLFARIESLVASVVQGRGESVNKVQPGRGEVGGGADQETAQQDGVIKVVRRLVDFLPRVPGASVPAWHCKGNNSTRVCFAYSVILTPCPPFSPVHWSPCPFYAADLSEEGLKRQSIAKQVGPREVDARPEGFDKEKDNGNEYEKRTGSILKEEALEGEDNSKNKNDDGGDVFSEQSETHPKFVDGRISSGETLSEDSKSIRDGDKKEEKEKKEGGETKEDNKKITEKEKEESDNNKIDSDNKAAESKGAEDVREEAKEEEESPKEDKEGSHSSQTTDDSKRSRKSKSDEDKKSPEDISKNADSESKGSDEKEKDVKTGSDAVKDSNAASSTSNEKKADDEKKDTKSTSPKKKEKTQSPAKDKKGKGSAKTENPKERKLLYTSTTHDEPKDCWDHYQRGRRHNGVYKVRLVTGQRLQVFCDMRSGGWTVVLKRQDGSVDFYRPWQDYKKGFGEVLGEHYMGNDHLHRLTNQDRYSLAVDLWDWGFQRQKAFYDDFWVDDEDAAYRLHIYEHSGDAPDALLKHNLMKFSTYDRDNDLVTKEFKDFDSSCARRFRGAGWYYKCYVSNVFGLYYPGGDIPPKKFDGVTWKPWTGPNYSLKEVIFKIRPAGAED